MKKLIIPIISIMLLSGCIHQPDAGNTEKMREQIRAELYPKIENLISLPDGNVRYTSNDGYSIDINSSLIDNCLIVKQAVEGSGKLRDVFKAEDKASGANIMIYATENNYTAEQIKKLCSDKTAMESTLNMLGYTSTRITAHEITNINGADALVLSTEYEQSGQIYTGGLTEYFSDNKCYYAVTTLTPKTTAQMQQLLSDIASSLKITEKE